VLPHPYEFVYPHNWACDILGNKLTESGEHWFVAAVVVELGKKIVEADLGERSKVSVIQLNLSNRSFKKPATLNTFSEFVLRPCMLEKWLYPSSFFPVTR